MSKRVAEVEIDGNIYRLGYNFNSIADAEEVAKCNLLEALGLAGISARQLRGLIYAMIVPFEGLQQEPEAALRQLGELCRIDTIPEWLRALGEASAIAVSEEYFAKYQAAIEAAEKKQESGDAPQGDAPADQAQPQQ